MHENLGMQRYIASLQSHNEDVAQINENDDKFSSHCFQWHFSHPDLKKMLTGKKFSDDEEVIAEAYFKAKGQSYYKKGIENLEDYDISVF